MHQGVNTKRSFLFQTGLMWSRFVFKFLYSSVAIRFKQTMPTDTSAACHLSFASLFFNFFGGACVTPTPRSRLNPLSFPFINRELWHYFWDYTVFPIFPLSCHIDHYFPNSFEHFFISYDYLLWTNCPHNGIGNNESYFIARVDSFALRYCWSQSLKSLSL